MLANKQTPIAVFIGIILVFAYMLLTESSGLGGPIWPEVTIFTLVFRYGLTLDALGTILLRTLFVFLAGFSLSWALLTFIGFFRPGSVSSDF